MKKVTLFFALLVLTNIAYAQRYLSPELSDAEKIYGLSQLNTEVKYNFVFYNELKFDWDSLCQAAIPKVLATKTSEDYCKELQSLCVMLNDGHTDISTGDVPVTRKRVKPLPMITKKIGNQILVNEVYSSTLKNKGIERGVEILQIDGIDVLKYAETGVKPYVAYSTPRWREHKTYDSFELTKGEGDKTISLLLKNEEGKTFTYESNRNVDWDMVRPNFGYSILENNVGMLRVGSFMVNNFREELKKVYKEIEKTDALIIDLRNNEGGNSNDAEFIIRHLTNKPVKGSRWSSRKYVATHGSWGVPQEWHMQDAPSLPPISTTNAYSKPVIVLVNSGTYSSAENFCVLFKGMKRGKMMGSTTAGSTGNPIRVNLASNINVGICTRNEWDIEGNKFIGVGVKPDIEVDTEMTKADFLAGRDLVLERALDELKR